MLKHRISQDTKQLEALRGEIPHLKAAIAKRIDTRGDQFRMQVGEQIHNERADAARALAGRITDVLSAPRWDASDHPVGQLGGYELTAKRQYRDDQPYVLVDVVGVPVDGIAVSVGDVENVSPGLVVRFENALRSLGRKLAAKHEWIDEITTEIARAGGEFGKPFQHQDALHTAYATRKAINDKLAAAAAPPAVPASVGTDPDVAASLGVLAAAHAPPSTGHQHRHNPNAARLYGPSAGRSDSAPELD
jgi:hypothetical protein